MGKLLRKLKTALSVLKDFGPREAVGLLGDNLSKFGFYFARALSGAINRAAGNVLLRLPRRGGMRILYVTTDFEAFHSQTVRYRVHNLRKALRTKAETRFEVFEGGVYKNRALIAWADLVVLMRTTYTKETGELIANANELGRPVVFDIDDIIFLPDYAPDYCRVLGDTSEENVEARGLEFEGFEKTFRLCDYATASTQFIADIMAREGKRAYVVHNCLNGRQIRIGRRVSAHKKPQGVRAIGYLSGTKTHDRDFAKALPSLVRIAGEYPDVELRTAGYLDLSALPQPLAARTRPACYMSWPRLMKYGAQSYLNIAPLDVDNPFCHAKSELKFFEAAAAGVPTVASATDTYRRCIEDGENGLLASNDGEWYAALKRLLDDRDFYKKVSKNAKKTALERYSPEANADEALAAYSAVLIDFRDKKGI